ncbi:TetR/AcrR family transcriptional regulator [Lacisediminihabitans sp. FW035]
MTLERTVGRKPDPQIEPRVMAAALAVYAEVGWAAFTLDAVSRRAHVGKAALYGRWDDKAALLRDALLSKNIEPEVIDTGSIRGDLLGVANIELSMWGGESGQAKRRAAIDAVTYPEILGPVRDAYRRTVIESGRDIIQRAIGRGELDPGVSTALILDALSGSVEHRLAYIPDSRRADFDLRADEYLEALVDFVLAAATSPSARSHFP